jgi:2-(1,2-epoxy-1,2-dihydrophenyl)acetyl-CoA isomerase
MTFETIQFSVSDNVAHVVLNRAEAGNAINLTMATELLQVANACRDNEQIGAVLLSANGPIFCAGGDLKFLESLGKDLKKGVRAMTRTFHQVIAVLSNMDAPVVAAVNGAAAGGGLAIALMSSIVVASVNARFVASYSRVGITPDCGFSYFLPRHVGLRVAEEMLLSNRMVEASEAQTLGMVNEVVAHDLLMDRALEIAKKLAAGPTHAFGATRRLLLQSMDASLQEQLDREAECVLAMMEKVVFD